MAARPTRSFRSAAIRTSSGPRFREVSPKYLNPPGRSPCPRREAAAWPWPGGCRKGRRGTWPLAAEALRDSLLVLAGNLAPERPGPHPFPPVNTWGYTAHHQFKAVYPTQHRSVYLMVQRLHPHPYLALFNGPDTSATAPR